MAAVRVTLILCLLPLMAHAGVYKWVDANGQTHFGDRPPAQVASSEVATEVAPPQTDPSARERHRKMTEFLDEQQQERQQRQAQEQQARNQAQQQAEKCQALQARLKHMDSISTFYNLDEQGERVFVSESQNRAIRERFRKKVANACER